MRASQPMLSVQECMDAQEQVLAARKFWVHRHATLPSYTLGAASYLDIEQSGISGYYVQATRGNAVLRRRFGWLYDRLAETLAGLLGCPVVYHPRQALPGFHVYLSDDSLDRLEPRVHFDLQDEPLEWGDDNSRRPNARISFTVPIAIPADGAGLYIWDVTYDEARSLNEAELRALVAQRTRHHHAYQLGEILVHSGDELHQIANDRLPRPGESRMTLQGHGRLSNEIWHLYW